ncbi:MAG: MerR family DNA-binding transcriptional regulator [Candidatus Sungbacteria bacterium]|uniref:MerR family DNA-binding transcriptional regulator n=1 Tax=Candidatus Sungiibacteriota bacterium TaxID=2750080 RepID=A0A933DSV0_9BACT|nr:MerR family DNA-binding transcriptional regulator [Candidatus Sungbacteria bacterium]
MNERYLTIREVSRIIGVTPLTLRNWDRRGLLAAYRNPANNYRMYRYADVADFIAEMKMRGPSRGEIQKLEVTAEV